MEYEIYLRREVFEFLRRCRSSDRDRILEEFRALSHNPHRRGNTRLRDRNGRDIEVLIVRQYAIFYWPDHAVKEVKITEIRIAGRL